MRWFNNLKVSKKLSSLAFDLQRVMSQFKFDTAQVLQHREDATTQRAVRAASAAAGANS